MPSFRADLSVEQDSALKDYADSLGIPKTRVLTSLIEMVRRGHTPVLDLTLTDDPKLNQLLEWIENKQTFEFSYADAQGKAFTFDAHYAEIVWREKRSYLEIWTTNTEGADFQPLKHNRCLRLDRILNDAIFDAHDVDWRIEGLDTIDIEFSLHGSLAHSYSARPDDLDSWWLDGNLTVRRKVSNVFWFLRSILSYGAQCEVWSPDSIREMVKEHFRQALEQYQ